MKTFYGSTFINKDLLKESNINHPIKLEYYKVINEDELQIRKSAKFGIDIIKTEYLEGDTKIENKTIKHLSNDEQRVNELLDALKNNQVTPVGLEDVIIDFSKENLFL